VAARRDIARLRFVHRVRAMQPSLLTRAVYDQRERDYDEREAKAKAKAKARAEAEKKKRAERRHESGAEQEERKEAKPAHHGLCATVRATLSTYALRLPPAVVGERDDGKRAARDRHHIAATWARTVEKAVLAREQLPVAARTRWRQ